MVNVRDCRDCPEGPIPAENEHLRLAYRAALQESYTPAAVVAAGGAVGGLTAACTSMAIPLMGAHPFHFGLVNSAHIGMKEVRDFFNPPGGGAAMLGATRRAQITNVTFIVPYVENARPQMVEIAWRDAW